VTSARSLLRGAASLVLVALMVGPSAQAGTPSSQGGPPASGHASNEWLMMGRNCGAGIS